MANALVTKIELEGQRKVMLHVAGYLDTSNITLTPIALLSSFQTTNPAGSKLLGFGVERIQYTGSHGLVVQLAWNASVPQTFANLANVADLQMATSSRFTPINNKAPGYDGSIVLNTNGFLGGGFYGFTLVLDLVKQY